MRRIKNVKTPEPSPHNQILSPNDMIKKAKPVYFDIERWPITHFSKPKTPAPAIFLEVLYKR
ncbi:hypothetical protein [Allomuricauda sp. CP2A]|uniref:hypothetical protein n=1 Tax=Allomuricauda sp. CP2A TaxID=1848189 RepID=UPI0011477A98|nr:hypothetical protein [Muricauda sp. CP2A]